MFTTAGKVSRVAVGSEQRAAEPLRLVSYLAGIAVLVAGSWIAP